MREDERAELVRLPRLDTELRMHPGTPRSRENVLKRSMAVWVDEARCRNRPTGRRPYWRGYGHRPEESSCVASPL